MIWAVENRYGLDALNMRWSRVMFRYRGHEWMYSEETGAADGK
jgi:hypothetical protein